MIDDDDHSLIDFQGQEHSEDESIRGGYNSGTDDERSNDAFANLRARSTSPMHTTAILNDDEDNNKRSRSAMSDTDTSGDEDQFLEDEVQEVRRRFDRKENVEWGGGGF